MAGMSRYSIEILKGADFDIQQAIEWYEAQKVGLGFDFYNKFYELTQLLSSNPFLFQEYYLFTRRAVLTRFSYNVFYAIDEVNKTVEIIAVLRQKVSPAELRGRINLE